MGLFRRRRKGKGDEPVTVKKPDPKKVLAEQRDIVTHVRALDMELKAMGYPPRKRGRGNV